MIGVAAVPDEALVVEAGGMGAPTVGAEKLDAYECEAALLGHSAGRKLPSGSSACLLTDCMALMQHGSELHWNERQNSHFRQEGGNPLMLCSIQKADSPLQQVTFCAGPNAEGLYAVMSCEIGGGNGLEPLAIGARMGLPVVDADFMGRAFPELQVLCSQAAYISR